MPGPLQHPGATTIAFPVDRGYNAVSVLWRLVESQGWTAALKRDRIFTFIDP